MIKRTFKDIDEKQIFDADKQHFLTQLGWLDGLTWETLLRSKRILLISEAGSGKTHECREQARRLAANGEAAFFVELASLASTHLRDLLGYEEETRFDLWLASESEIATFFLDSYDELQLTKGSFKQALDRFVKGIQSNLNRVRVVVTTRPIPFDGQLVRSKLPVPPQIKLQSTEEKEREFASMALGEHMPISSGQSNEESIPEWRTVALMPLSNPQIAEFAELQGVKNTAELLSDIERQNAFEFARRPQDLIELCADWRAGFQLRTHRQQVEASIRIKLKPRDREDRGELTELSIDKAIEGASRLALAMWLTRRLTIRHSAKADNVQQGEAALDPTIILSDWTQDERKTLLERPLFGFASYGRVRFHHRSVSEFLAAKRLHEMRNNGMSLRALKRLLFIETKGNTIVLPSKRALAGWLASFNDDIYQAIRDYEPTLLLDEGDPASLTFAQRKQALGAYVQRYGRGGRRGLHTPSIQIKRFATPELTDEINLQWQQGIENHEVRCVLLELIERGVIFGSSDLVYSVATDSMLVEVERIYAIHALQALNDPRLGEIAALMVSQHPDWPDEIVREAILALFPSYLSVAQLCQSLGWLQWKKRSVSNLSWRLPSLIKNAPLVMSQLEELREKLVTLISDGLQWRQEQWPHMVSPRQYLSSILAAVCIRGLDHQCSEQWIHACVLALRLRQHEYDDEKIHKELSQRINELDSKNRKQVFWAIDALVQSLCPIDDIWKRVVEIIPYDSLINFTVQLDRAWVVSDLQDKDKPFFERQMLMHVALYLLRISPIDLRPLVIDCPDLILYLDEIMKPSTFDIKHERARREEAIRDKRRERKAAKNRASWVMLHREILECPDNNFSDERCKNLAWDLFRVMISGSDDSNLSGWNRSFLESHFGETVTDWLRTIFMECWREHLPTLICERPEDQRSTYFDLWRFGLAGLYAEAEGPNWASQLTYEEAMRAARYSLLELNELPSWIYDLVKQHPSAISEVFGKELDWVLSTSANEIHHSMLLQRLHNAPDPVTILFIPRMIAWLSEIKPIVADESQLSSLISRYSRVIELILKYGDIDQKAQLCSMAQEYISKKLLEPAMLLWLSTLIRLNPGLGVDVLEEKLREIEPEPLSKAVEWFTKLFNERHDGINIRNNDFTPELLLRLARLAYQHIRRQDDAEHEGCYTPDMRDNAEYARNAILTALLESQGEEGWQVKHDMAIDPLFSHFKDRILALAQEAWAKEIDSVLLDEQQCRELEHKGELPLTTNAAMFTLLRDRLADLDELLNSDESPRELWAEIHQEKLMRRAIAQELQHAANGLYKVVQEAVTADEKETDIRLCSLESKYEAVIELKIEDGNRWSANVLRETIGEQLAIKYLSLETRCSGALVITISKNRYWQHPDSGERIGLEELKELLDDEARRVEREMGGAVSLTIHVLDLRPRLLTEKQSRSGVMKKRVNPA